MSQDSESNALHGFHYFFFARQDVLLLLLLIFFGAMHHMCSQCMDRN